MKRLGRSRGLYAFVTLSGFAVYLAQSLFFAVTQRSIIDENLYLYKGFLFTTGVYRPFEDYGFWTQKAPLSYLFYGWVQMLFGPGLTTGRYAAVAVGALTVLLFWLVARRLSGKWWASGLVCVVALSPVQIRYFSAALSQGLVAFLLMGILFLVLGERRRTWQLATGAFLAGILVMTRQNMLPVLLLLLAYLFWQHGWRLFGLAALAAFLPILVVHALYWPGILKMWTPWLPASLTPFLAPWRAPVPAVPVPGVSANAQILSLLEGFRFHFAALAGGLTVVLLWPGKKGWEMSAHYQRAVFLVTLFLVLVVFHAWAGMGNTPSSVNNGAFTFSSYLSSFALLGLLAVADVLPRSAKHLSAFRQALILAFILLVSVGLGYGNFDAIGDALAYIPIPRFKAGEVLDGSIELWRILLNKFGVSYETSRWLLPGIVGFLAGVLLLVGGWFLWKSLRKRAIRWSFGSVAGVSFFFAGTLLGPSLLFGDGFRVWDCADSPLSNYAQTGAHLASVIPPGSRVYWAGGNASAVLLYLPDIEIFPQQLDTTWNYINTADTDAAARYGFWNDAMDEQWKAQANVFLIQQVFYMTMQSEVSHEDFNEYPTLYLPLNCEAATNLRIFIREP